MKISMKITLEKKSFRQAILSLNGIRIGAELLFLFILAYLNIVSWQHLMKSPAAALEREGVGTIITGEERPFRSPTGIAVSREGVFLADTRSGDIKIYNQAGTYRSSIGGAGSEPGQFSDPRGIAIGPNGELVVADTGNNRIQVFTYNEELSSWGLANAFGRRGSASGDFESPTAVAVNSGGYIYVADTGNNRVQIFDSRGDFSGFLEIKSGVPGGEPGDPEDPGAGKPDVEKKEAGGEGGEERGAAPSFNAPSGLFIDGDNRVYVADSGNNLIKVFDSRGDLLGQWGSPGSGQGELNFPVGLAVYEGNVYVSDSGNNRIQVFASSDGSFVKRYTGVDSSGGAFSNPQGLAILEGSFYVADTGNNRIKILPCNSDPDREPGMGGGAPAAVSGVSVENLTANSVQVSWRVDNGEGVSGFRVEASNDGENYSEVRSVEANINSIVINDLQPNTLYYFRVASYNNYGNSDYSASSGRYTLAETPSFDNLSWDREGMASVSWVDSGASSYYVQNVETEAGSDWTSETSYRFSDLKCGETYSFRIKARNSDGEESAWSEPVSIETMKCDGTTASETVSPTFAEIYSSDSGVVYMNWKGESAAYYVENVTNRTNSGWIKENEYKFGDLKCAAAYNFRIKGRDEKREESAWSEIISVKTLDCPSASVALSAPVISPNTVAAVTYVDAKGYAVDYDGQKILKVNSVYNAARIAISDNPDFKGSSWDKYYPGQPISLPKTNNQILYVKFLSPEGGESKVMAVQSAPEAAAKTAGSYTAKPQAETAINAPSISVVAPSSIITAIPGRITAPAKTSETSGVSAPKASEAPIVEAKKPAAATTVTVNEPSSAAASASQPAPINVSAPALKVGSVNNEVKVVQTVLKDLGYFNYSKTTGYFGPITKEAVKKFQKSNSLPATGIVDTPTKKALNKYVK